MVELAVADPKPVCGIVMPISEMDGCPAVHWDEVKSIISDAIRDAGFEPNLVSDADDVGVIQKRIIHNLYTNPVVVCDVSGRNPNVMFELGMRLAFDRPAIIIKDDVTQFSFDTAPIEHLQYPRDLRFKKILEFKKSLTAKIAATHKKAQSSDGYTTFLKHFGEFKVAKIDEKEVSGQEFIIDELRSVRAAIRRLEYGPLRKLPPARLSSARYADGVVDICVGGMSEGEIEKFVEKIAPISEVDSVEVVERGPAHSHILVRVTDDSCLSSIESAIGRSISRVQIEKIRGK